MRPWLQIRAINRILVEARPLFKRLLRVHLMLLVRPLEHLGLKRQAYRVAVGADDPLRVIEQVVGVDDADLGASRCTVCGTVYPFCGAVALICMTGSYLPDGAEVLEDAADFVVAGFGGVEVVEACFVVEGWDGAAEVRGNARVRVADQKGEVEAGEKVGGHDGRVVGFGVGVERIGRLGLVVFFATDVGLAIAVGMAVDFGNAVCVAVRVAVCMAVC